jgi:hypothetical protein
LYIEKWRLELLVSGIVSFELIHLSGPTGSAKSSLIEALYLNPKNFESLCAALGEEYKPLKLFPVEMATYETPGELFQRRAINKGSTYDEKSDLVKSLEEACSLKEDVYPLIWLREMGRVHSSSVQVGLLNLMTKGDIFLPDGSRLNARKISWIADSNYQAEFTSTHVLVTLDDALKRRFTINLTLDYLPAEQEVMVMTHLLKKSGLSIKDDSLIKKVVNLGNVIRRYKDEGNLQSIPPPTIFGYSSFFRLYVRRPHLSLQQIAQATLLGNANAEDCKHLPALFNEVFGLQIDIEDDLGLNSNLF